METAALYIGYAVLGILGLALLLLALFILWTTIIGIHRIVTTKQTIRFMRKAEAKATYEALQVALQYLISKGAPKQYTLEEVEALIEKFRKEYKIK